MKDCPVDMRIINKPWHAGWWQLKICFFKFHPGRWGRFPIWRAYFSIGLVETANQVCFTFCGLEHQIFFSKSKSSKGTRSRLENCCSPDRCGTLTLLKPKKTTKAASKLLTLWKFQWVGWFRWMEPPLGIFEFTISTMDGSLVTRWNPASFSASWKA